MIALLMEENCANFSLWGLSGNLYESYSGYKIMETIGLKSFQGVI